MKNNPKSNQTEEPAEVPGNEEEVLRQGLEQNPGNIDFCFRLVELLKGRNEESQAFEILARGAWDCLDHGRFTSAIDLMEKMLEIRPEHIQTHIEIGKTHLQVGRFPKALESFGQAFDAFLANGELQECEAALGLMARIEADATLYKVKKAELLAQKGEVEEALVLFRDCARILEDEGQPQDFLEVGERMLELDPGLDDIRIKVGETLIAEANAFVNYGLFNKAVKALCRAIKYDPGQVDTYMTLARVLVRGGRLADAVDMVILAARKVKGTAQKRELLLLARELTGEDAQIADLADELEVDLNVHTPGADWPFPDEHMESLADEATSPTYSLTEFSREVTGENGPTLEAVSVVKNLTDLLGIVAGVAGTRYLIVGEAGKSEPVAQILVCRGRVFPGVRIMGKCFVDEEFEKEHEELAARLRDESEAIWTRGDGTDDEKKEQEQPALTAGERELISELTSRAMVALAQIATMTVLSTTLRVARETPASTLSFSVPALLMEAAAQYATPSAAMTATFEGTSEFGDEYWLMARTGQEMDFLPLQYCGVQAPRLDEMLAAADVARHLAGQAAELGPLQSSSPFLGLSFVFSQGAWGALVDKDSVLLGRSANAGIGRLLSRIRDLTIGGLQ